MTEEALQISMEDLAAGVAIRPDMLKDLLSVGKLQTESAQKLASVIRSLSGLHPDVVIKTKISETLSDAEKELGNSVFRVLINLDSDEILTILTALKGWVSRKEARKKVFSDELRDRLKVNLNALIVEYPAIELMKKADRLIRDTGDELESVKFVCDLRPVFDKPRKNVDAFVLVANMRIRYLSQNGRRYSCEIALTEDELADLRKEIDQATGKLEVLKRVGATLANTEQEGGNE